MKTIVITGAGRGIGFEIVKQYLLVEKFRVIAISRNVDQLMKLTHPQLTIIKGDLVSDFENIIQKIKSVHPQIQTLINNAGIVINCNIEDLKDDDLYPTMNINFFTPLKLVRDLKPFFCPSTHIINISSMSGFQGSKKIKGLSLYSASKAALVSLTESIAEELKDDNIYCNCLALGSVDTDMIKVSIPGLAPKIDPIELASFICDFASNGHKLCNGQIIPITRDSF